MNIRGGSYNYPESPSCSPSCPHFDECEEWNDECLLEADRRAIKELKEERVDREIERRRDRDL